MAAYYLGKNMRKIDDILMKQTPPSEFSRPPRSIQRHMKYWKASELRSWLLYYSLPLVLDFLPPLYIHHFGLLVCAVHILLQDCITPNQIDAADLMLHDFIALLPELYGGKSCTANAHLLGHLPKYVKLWGPLWTHSAFGFESYNGHLKYLFHSRSVIVDQLVSNLDVQQTLQLLYPYLLEHESAEVLDFLDVMNGKTRSRAMKKIDESMYVIGKTIQRKISREECELFGSTCDTIEVLTRIYHDTLYHSALYVCQRRRKTKQ